MYRLYSIYDVKAHLYGVPFIGQSDDLAKRSVDCALLSAPASHLFLSFPGDFELYFLGEVDDRGNLVPLENGPKAVAFLSDFLTCHSAKSSEEE